MKRREFIAFLGGAAATWPLTARAQEPRRVIGVLGSASAASNLPDVEAAFIQGLKDTDFIEGKNISIEWRWAEGQYNRLPALAGELVARNVSVIFAFDLPSAFAAKAATKTIPIVFTSGADPVKLGLVDSLNRPGGNLTGVFTLVSALGPKQLELLHEMLPSAGTIAFLVNTDNPNVQADAPEIQAAADALGQRLEVLTASTDGDLEAVFMTMVERRAGALVVKADPFFMDRRERLVALAARYAMPAIYSVRPYADVGGLASYGAAYVDLCQQAGSYAGKILKGAKPADLPVQQGVKFELVINLKTAKALGLKVPFHLLQLADEVIE
ncbi:MAG TPA: ABC transporter substrate-binding protein [Steroidobacteraceae bacterium]|nr:ABC transporter substrate-binding protein [Steroidobacteraceae bacterium]